jgi:hypothetical protein
LVARKARLSFSVQGDGLIVDVVIWLNRAAADDLTARGAPVPAPIRCRGLLDTRTDVSAVDPSVPARLGLSPTRQATTTTAAGIMTVNGYTLSLSISDTGTPGAPLLSVPSLQVTELATPLGAAEVVIGLDVLLTARLFLDGPNRTFTLDF